MRERLKRNICNLDEYTVLSKVKDLSAQRNGCIGDALEYACKFWTKHLQFIPGNSPRIQEVQGAIDQFFTKHFLHWIEVLSLLGSLDVGVYGIRDVEQWYTEVSALLVVC